MVLNIKRVFLKIQTQPEGLPDCRDAHVLFKNAVFNKYMILLLGKLKR
jgi:hypothetical protein